MVQTGSSGRSDERGEKRAEHTSNRKREVGRHDAAQPTNFYMVIDVVAPPRTCSFRDRLLTAPSAGRSRPAPAAIKARGSSGPT